MTKLRQLFYGQALEVQGRVEEVEVGADRAGIGAGHRKALLNCNVF
jgi:hypothetical protein